MKSALIVGKENPFLPGTAGQAVVKGFIKFLLSKSYHVTYIGFTKGKHLDSKSENLTEIYIKYKELDYNKLAIIKKIITGIEPHEIDNDKYAGIISSKSKFDLSIVWEPIGIKYFGGIKHSERDYIILSDPIFDRLKHSLDLTLFKNKFICLIAKFFEPLNTRLIIGSKKKILMYGSHHTRVWKKKLGRSIGCLKPALDVEISYRTQNKAKLSVVVGGTANSTATRAGEMRIYDIQRLLLNDYSNIHNRLILVGYGWEKVRYADLDVVPNVDDYEKYLLSNADVFVYLSDYPVGVRTRICSALSAGCIIYTSKIILKNMPELATVNGVFFEEDISLADFFNKINLCSNSEIICIQNDNINFFKNNYSIKILEGLLDA